MDSCFSGTFLSQTRGNNDLHYLKLNENKSRWVISSGRHEKVSDGHPGEGSPFATILNEFFEKNLSSSFSVGELAIAVSKGTGSSTKQQPIFAHIEGVGHEDGQMIFNLTHKGETDSLPKIDSNLSRIAISYESAIKLHDLGFTQKSILGYYKENDSVILKECDSSNNFICSAYTYEEIAEFIPENIDVDENTYLARIDGYDKIEKTDEWHYDFAYVSFQRTEVLDAPYMAICRCRGRMVAFSMTNDGYYN